MLRSTCVFLLIFAMVANADVQSGVVRSGGQPIPGAIVTAQCGTDKIPTTTDDGGRFELGGLPNTSCKYTVLMFGFEAAQKDATASATPLTFDLNMQGHATLPVAPSAAPAPVAPAPKPVVTAAEPAPAPATPDAPKPSMAAAAAAAQGGGRPARGARGASGAAPAAAAARGGRAGAATPAARGAQSGGFQNLSLVQNEDAPVASDAPASTLGGGADSGTATGDAFTVNGTLSQGVQAQAGDGLGMGGPGFGFGAGGPGGQDPFGAGGDPTAAAGGRAGGRGGAPGGAPGGGRGGAGGFAAGPGGGGARGAGGGGGGRGGGRAGGPGRGPNGVTAFGNRAGRGRGPQWQASMTYNFTNSALNARPYSVASATTSGLAPVKPATATNQLGFTLGGPIMIPKTKINLRNSRWNVNVTGARNRVGVENVSSVPIAAFRTGDFSSIANTNVIYNPQTNQPFANNIIPQSQLSPAALKLLSLYPNPTGVGLVKNYEFDASNPSNTNTFTSQISDPITPKDRLNINMSAQSRNSATVQTFGFRDPTSGGGKALTVSYSRTLQPTMTNTFSFAINRNVTNNLSYFSDGANIAALDGIGGVLATPATYGPPTLVFNGTSQLASLSDATPSTNHSTTFTLTEAVVKTMGKHNFQFGLTGSKRESNSLTASNARGSFTFTGASTQLQALDSSGVLGPVAGTGYDLADFLLGLPGQTSINNYLNGNDMFYYRQNSGAAYVSDDYRLSTRLTLNLGLRWEFYGPQTEKYGHMANLLISPDGTQATYVTPGQADPYNGGIVANGLIKADYGMVEPRIGFAWKPWAKRAVVFRGGYGIAYNGGALAQQGSKLTVVPPFVQSATLTPAQALADTGQTLTLANGFPALPNGTITNTYGISPNYKPAMAQQWNSIVQYTAGRSYVFQLSYFGTKGTDLDVLLGPNRATPGASGAAEAARVPIKNALTNLQIDESVGSSIYHSGSFQVTRRLAKGFGGSATYTLAKSLDDTSTLGGGVVQIGNNYEAERAVTASVPLQNLQINFNYQSLANNQKSQFYWNLVRGWQLNGAYDVNTGTPFTATVSGDPSGTGIVSNARANATGLPVEDGSGFFNPAAFTLVPNGTYGTAGRNTIPGIVNFTLRASAMRSFRVGERHRLALTFTAMNPLNHVSITGIGTEVFLTPAGLPTSTYGLPTRAGPMRTVTAQARFTF